MIPRLYESTETDDSTEGLGALRDLISISIPRNRNEIPTLTMTYPNNGYLSDVISEGMIIVADMGSKESEKNQKFRIVDISNGQDAMTITANQVWADLSTIPLKQNITLANATPEFAFNAIKNALAWPMSELSFESDINTVANVIWQFTDFDSVNAAIIGGDAMGDTATNTMQSLYHGELQFNNYHLSLLKHAGQDNGITIKYGRNMQSITRDETTSDTYNAIMPYVTISSDNDTSSDDETTSDQPEIQNLTNGLIRIYSSPSSGQEPTDSLMNGKFIKLVSKTSQNTINGHTWYKTDTSGWIDERWITLDKSNKYLVNLISGQGTLISNSDEDGVIVKNQDSRLVKYVGEDNKSLWTSPFGGQLSSEKLHNGQVYEVRWKAKDISDQLWYNLGDLESEWIPAQEFYLNADNNVATEKVFGNLTITESVDARIDPNKTDSNFSWKNKGTFPIYEMQVCQNVKWYHLGQFDGHQVWIKEGAHASFQEVSLVDDLSKQATQQIPIYADPKGVTPTNDYYQVGSQFHLSAQAFSRGDIFYEIGPNQWVNGKVVDVTSLDKSLDEETEVDEHTLTLTEPVIASEFAKRTKAPLRVQAVDFSSYGIGNDKKRLLDVATAYMKQNKIGVPHVSLTVSYEQMQGAYQNLTAVDLYDYVSVIFDEVGIFEKAQCTSLTWDPIREIATSITIGQLPVSYTHYLNEYIESTVSSGTTDAKNQSTRLFNEAKEEAKKDNEKQIQAIGDLKNQVTLASQSWNKNFEKMNQKVEQVSDGMQNFLTGTQNGSVIAYPNWKNPIEIRIKTSSGGYVRLDNQGLTNVNADGVETFKVGKFADKSGVMIDDTWLSKEDIDWIHKQQNSK